MELSTRKTSITKGIAILMMLCLHLFNKPSEGLFEPLLYIGSKPLTYYISLFCDCCVAIYCFCSGYGLFYNFTNKKETYDSKNFGRVTKMFINYWIIFFLFVVFLGLLLGRGTLFPFSIETFLLNFSAIYITYNGAWWFFTTYILLIVFSKIIFSLVEKYNYIFLIICSLAIYVVSYIQRVNFVIQPESPFLYIPLHQITMFGNSLFPFLIGAISLKQKWFSKFSTLVQKIPYTNVFLILSLIAGIVLHGVFPSLFFAVFTGLLFIFCFNCIKIPAAIDKLLHYLSLHSTNIWLVHMFFYSIYFEKYIYFPKNPILIFIWLLLCSLASSYLINLIYNPLVKLATNKLKLQ